MGATKAKKAGTKEEKAASRAKTSARKSSPAVYTDPDLRDRLKAEIMVGEKGGEPGRWSARKSQLLASEYKKAGGGYKQGKVKKTESQEDLDAWTEEGWTTRDGEPAIREGETARYLPEEAWEELTPDQSRATDFKKRSSSKEGEQFVPNTAAARRARKKTTKKAPKRKASKAGKESPT